MAESLVFTAERVNNRNENFLCAPRFQASNEQFAVSLRRTKRQEINKKKRKIFSEIRYNELDKTHTDLIEPSTVSKENFIELGLLLSDPNPAQQEFALRVLKNIYLNGNELGFKLTMTIKIIPKIVIIASNSNSYECLKEAAWCLCNLASGPSYIANALMAEGTGLLCKTLITTSDKDIKEYAVWCIGNLAADSVCHRKALLDLGILEILIENYSKLYYMLHTMLWAIKNLLEKGMPIKEATLKNLLKALNPDCKTKADNILIEVLWILSNLSDGGLSTIQILANNKILKSILSSAKSINYKISLPAIRTIGNIAAGICEQTQILLQNDVLDVLYFQYEKSSKSKIKVYVLWTISNITAGTRSQIEIIATHPILVTAVKAVNDLDPAVQKEALSIVNNIVQLGTVNSVKALINVGIIKESKCFLDTLYDNNLVLNLLTTILLILKLMENYNLSEIKALMLQSGVYESLENIYYTKNPKLDQVLGRILKYFEVEECFIESIFS
jgi:importin subunit alpha-6/7